MCKFDFWIKRDWNVNNIHIVHEYIYSLYYIIYILNQNDFI